MKRNILILCSMLLCLAAGLAAQVPVAIGIQILKAEDARRYDETLEKLIKHPTLDVRYRAALAAGRIGDEKAIPALTELLENEAAINTTAMAAFAIGEIESVRGADAILKTLADPQTPHEVRARAVEAAGKIAAANAKDPKAKELAAVIMRVLDFELTKRSAPYVDVVRLGLTAALRARPTGGEETIRKYLAFTDPDVVADALNTLARLKAKNASRDARDLLATSVHAVVRANAARLLGSAEEKDAFDILLKAAINDADSRVRVSAIRSLASLKDARAADPLLEHGEKLLKQFAVDPAILKLLSKPVPAVKPVRNPIEKNELLEIATAIGRLLSNTRNQRAMNFLDRFITIDDGRSSEIAVARLRVAPGKFSSRNESKPLTDWHQYSTLSAILGEFSKVDATTDELKKMKGEAPGMARIMAEAFASDASKEDEKFVLAGPDFLQAFAEYKTDDLPRLLRDALKNKDVFIRSTAAGLLADQPSSKENVEALKTAFDRAFITDKHDNDAQLSIMDALFKLDKNASVGSLLVALNAQDYLVRKKGFAMLENKDLQKDFPGIPTSLENARAKHKDQVLPYSAAFETKLGQVLNTDLDYRRALSRKNGSVKAVLTTEKGMFTIVFNPEEAPLTVDNWIKLARSGYFNGHEVHRVVPNFVMQDGDPLGNGSGGPGWSIRCEVNMLPYDRGAVGMALSGKDTGGSQWFVTHAPQPHLDGGYTVFARVISGMEVVDAITRGDHIRTINVTESGRK
ncbi:MAG: peptidylprolyl isomerase [Acidobacteriota bacterium]